ncbi:MAG: hypothetical protein DRJ15_03210 [Bacteroidetes bacterium]|nr:MAG: hypothetical protein DRJ15_03210 [Bacteroidota bacterium]
MSGFNKGSVKLPPGMIEFSHAIINGDEPLKAVKENKQLIDNISPEEVIILIDELAGLDLPIEKLKTGINKLLNLFYTSLKNYPAVELQKDSFPDFLVRNNREMDERLKTLRPLIRDLNKNKNDQDIKARLLKGFTGLVVFESHYTIKENVLFPVLEKFWKEYRCLPIMWSFHDDIRRDLKQIRLVLEKPELDLPRFNKLAGDLFFMMYAIKFREEKILFPVMMNSIPKREIKNMLYNSRELLYPYVRPEFEDLAPENPSDRPKNEINLGTGFLTAKQIQLLFNHLPVDITYVDETNKVKYFSTPEHRIFPRTNSIIGRDVANCHPPESVHIVEDIIEEFRSGRQDHASFWINRGELCVLIKYFAIRNKSGKYCGVVEVSQEISDIRKIEGEKRLLDWNK